MKKRILLCLSGLLMVMHTAYSQTKEVDKRVFLRVYSNIKKGLTKDDLHTSFEIRRVYIGYKGNINDFFQAEVKFDIGSPDDLSQFSLIRRYAYFKTAALTYKKDRLTGWFGLFDMQQFKLQEDFWGYRYIYKSFQDENKFGPSADIGAGIKYYLSDKISADFVFSNGEGYRDYAHNNFIKNGIGVSYNPVEPFSFRVYYDFIYSEIYQSSFSLFAGYKQQDYRLGTEYNFKKNNRFVDNNLLHGFSFFGTYILDSKWEIFARYDRLTSNLTEGQETPWNIYNDGTSIISGIQYIPSRDIRFSLNYQDKYSLAKNGPDRAYIYFNVQFDL